MDWIFRTMALAPAALSGVLLGACATATPYQPAAHGLGYSEQKIQAQRYRVTFAGNASTPRQTVENYLLYRAAELTLGNGFDYFEMADTSTDRETRYSHTISAFGGFGRYGWHPAGVVGLSSSEPTTQYQAQADIVMYAGKKPADNIKAFDARELKENLEGVIVRPVKEGSGGDD